MRRVIGDMTRRQGMVLWALAALALLLVADLVAILLGDIDRPDRNDGQRYGHSRFFLVDGVVHAQVVGSGLVAMPQADPASFAPLEAEQRSVFHMGRDRTHVYCGNHVLAGMNPARTVVLGQDYVSDSRITYFCSESSAANPDQQGLAGFWQAQRHALGLGPRRQSHIHAWVQLPESAVPYRILPGAHLATDGRQVYLAGQLLPGADPLNIRVLPWSRGGRAVGSSDYLADTRHVYYRGKRLDIPASPAMYVVSIAGGDRQPQTLIDPAGSAYTQDLAFDSGQGPYLPLSAPDAPVNHMLLAGTDGVYYAEPVRGEVLRLTSEVTRTGGWRPLSDRLASNGSQVLVLHAGREWIRRGRQGGRVLQERWTRLWMLDDGESGGWVSAGKARQGLGEVWRHGSRMYFLPGERWSLGLEQPIYRIADEPTRQWLLDASLPPLSNKDLRARIEAGQLTPTPMRELGMARSVYRFFGVAAALGVALAALVLALLGYRFLWQAVGWRGRPVLYVDGGRLYAGNLLHTFYPLAEVSCVTIHDATPGGQQGRRAGFSIQVRKGRTHRYVLKGEDIPMRLAALPAWLAGHGIRVLRDTVQGA